MIDLLSTLAAAFASSRHCLHTHTMKIHTTQQQQRRTTVLRVEVRRKQKALGCERREKCDAFSAWRSGRRRRTCAE
jgi:hypothetical protein